MLAWLPARIGWYDGYCANNWHAMGAINMGNGLDMGCPFNAELVLLFLHTSVILTRTLIPEAIRAQKFCALVVLLGSLDIPVVHFSVEWWNTLHQGASILHLAKPTISPAMLYPLLCMFAATTCLSVGGALTCANSTYK